MASGYLDGKAGWGCRGYGWGETASADHPRHLQQSDHATLGIAIADDVTLGGGEGAMSGQFLHVAQASAGFGDRPSGVGDHRAATAMRRTSFETELGILLGKPVDDALGGECTTAFRAAHRAVPRLTLFGMKAAQGTLQDLVAGDAARRAHLGDVALNMNLVADIAVRVGDHRPAKPADLAGTQAGLEAEQHHDAVPQPMPLVGDMIEQSLLIEGGEDFGGFAVACVRAARGRHKAPLNAQSAAR